MQPDLFDLLALSHRDDPATSREAAERHVASGRRERHAEIVLGLVQRFPAATAIELWYLATDAERAELKEPQEIRRRLVCLRKRGLVRRGPARHCTVRGTSQVTWFVTQEG